jgi:hypothetical protein
MCEGLESYSSTQETHASSAQEAGWWCTVACCTTETVSMLCYTMSLTKLKQFNKYITVRQCSSSSSPDRGLAADTAV